MVKNSLKFLLYIPLILFSTSFGFQHFSLNSNFPKNSGDVDEMVSCLEAFMNMQLMVDENNTVSFSHYKNREKKYQLPLKDVTGMVVGSMFLSVLGSFSFIGDVVDNLGAIQIGFPTTTREKFLKELSEESEKRACCSSIVKVC